MFNAETEEDLHMIKTKNARVQRANLVLKGKLDAETAAEMCGITPKEFEKRLAEAKKHNR